MNSSLLTLLVLVGVAAFLLIKLRSVLGTKTGHEKPPEYLTRRNEEQRPKGPVLVEDEPAVDPDDPAAAPLAKMRKVESDFSPSQFAEGARKAYEMLLMAFESGDKETLERYLSPDVYASFAAVIDQRSAEGLTVDARFIGLRESKIVGARFDEEESVAEIDMKFVGEMVTVVRDSEHRVVEGDPNEVRRETDVWTFGRQMGASDPNWLLIATGE